MIPFLLAVACVFSAPLVLALFLCRRWVNPTIGRSSVALSFASSTAYMLWRIEWFDVWRHGIPAVSLLVVYLTYMAAFAAVGWFLASRLIRRPSFGEPLID